jgi:hypothetical protein
MTLALATISVIVSTPRIQEAAETTLKGCLPVVGGKCRLRVKCRWRLSRRRIGGIRVRRGVSGIDRPSVMAATMPILPCMATMGLPD